MCYVLQSVFVNTVQGPIEITGEINRYLLACELHPEFEFHMNHPAHFLTPPCHKLILRRIAFGPVPDEVRWIQELARNLLSNFSDPMIQFLDDCSFIFFPRWIEEGVLCRQLGRQGRELAMRVDSTIQNLGLAHLDMVALSQDTSGTENTPHYGHADAATSRDDAGDLYDVFQSPELTASAALYPDAALTESPSESEYASSDDSSVLNGMSGAGLYASHGEGEVDMLNSGLPVRQLQRLPRRAAQVVSYSESDDEVE